MVVRRIVRIALILAVVGVHVFPAVSSPVNAQTGTATATRTQKRLAKQTVLKKGLRWLTSQQDESGAFLGPSGEPDLSTTAAVISALIALRNAGVDVELDAAVDYLQQTDPSQLAGVLGGKSQLALIVLALVGAGGDPHDVGGVDLVALLADSWDADAGLYGDFLIEGAIVMMALSVAGEPIEEKASETLVAAQFDDGSWSYDGRASSGGGDAVTTAYAVQTLIAIGNDDDDVLADAIAYFRTVQAGEAVAFGVGAFRPSPDGPPDSNTTGLVLSALIAAGEDPKAEDWGKAVDGLLTFQNENGAFRYNDFQPFDDIPSTVSALIALAGAVYPVLPVST